ncbi:hypothetical protein IWW38_004063 [Coemansia aciculifera]|uniref:Uncharacterized protein n=1 Tax=Coemansia aciculifera TaxID=417176 RepID=A0ACC1LZK6_9FUNG|nr:hypothetical protein IWW38_004063 [Coemansia aciculifera]
MCEIDNDEFNDSISSWLKTVRRELQHLALTLCAKQHSLFRLEGPPPFADSLISLTLEGVFDQQDVEHLLPKFPNLRILNICASVSKPISDMSSAAQSLAPLNTSLRVLNVYRDRYFTGSDGLGMKFYYLPFENPVLHHYLGVLVGLVRRLPVLDTLRVDTQFVEGVNEGIGSSTDMDIAPEFKPCLRRLRVQPLNYLK